MSFECSGVVNYFSYNFLNTKSLLKGQHMQGENSCTKELLNSLGNEVNPKKQSNNCVFKLDFVTVVEEIF